MTLVNLVTIRTTRSCTSRPSDTSTHRQGASYCTYVRDYVKDFVLALGVLAFCIYVQRLRPSYYFCVFVITSYVELIEL